MPNIEKALRREKKEQSRRKMGRSGDSVFLIQEVQKKRADQLKKKKRDKAIKSRRKRKEESRNG